MRDRNNDVEAGFDNTQIVRQSFPADFDSAFDEAFRFPEPRENQKGVVKAIVKAFVEDDKDVVLLDAPPGFGKSGVINTVLNILNGNHYYVTPLKSLQEQLVEDDFIGDDMTEIMGRANYRCIHDSADPDTTVDNAKCQKEEDWECPIKSECPYYAQKEAAVNDSTSVMNLSYMMKVPMTIQKDDGQFSPRASMVIDECQGIESWSIGNIGFTVNKYSIPQDVYRNVSWPPERKREDFDTMVEWIRDEILPKTKQAMEYYADMPVMGDDDLDDMSRLKQFNQKVQRFLKDVQDNHWVHTYDVKVNKNRPDYKSVEFKPIFVGRFLDDLIWSKCNKFLLSSATIPKGDWLSEIGLDGSDVLRVNVSSPFPVENRPIVTTEAVGKMTYNERRSTMPDMVEKIKAISEHHEGEKGIVHCRGYNYIDLFKEFCVKGGHREWFNENCVVQDREEREKSLEQWVKGDKQIFLSVNMSEGIDLKGDKCRWQILMKALYPNMRDERVSYRIKEMDDWQWYNNKAVIQIEQAYGRAVRSPEDSAVFYILDSSAVDLIKRNKGLFHDWFLEAVDGGV